MEYETEDKDIRRVVMRLEGIKKVLVGHRVMPAVEMVWVMFADGTVTEPTRAKIEEVGSANTKDLKLNIDFTDFTRISQTDVLARIRDMKPTRKIRGF